MSDPNIILTYEGVNGEFSAAMNYFFDTFCTLVARVYKDNIVDYNPWSFDLPVYANHMTLGRADWVYLLTMNHVLIHWDLDLPLGTDLDFGVIMRALCDKTTGPIDYEACKHFMFTGLWSTSLPIDRRVYTAMRVTDADAYESCCLTCNFDSDVDVRGHISRSLAAQELYNGQLYLHLC